MEDHSSSSASAKLTAPSMFIDFPSAQSKWNVFSSIPARSPDNSCSYSMSSCGVLGELLVARKASAAHFNREYKNLFGLPPMRDVERLRGTARQNVSLAAD
jgi:hypothetical protein